MVEILHWEYRKTRKPHHCWGCGKEYPAGSDMVHAVYTECGEAHACYWCPTCEEYMRRYFERGDGSGYGGIYENDREGWEALRKEMDR